MYLLRSCRQFGHNPHSWRMSQSRDTGHLLNHFGRCHPMSHLSLRKGMIDWDKPLPIIESSKDYGRKMTSSPTETFPLLMPVSVVLHISPRISFATGLWSLFPHPYVLSKFFRYVPWYAKWKRVEK